MQHTAYIGMGGNEASPSGEPAETLAAAVLSLARLGQVAACSSLYLTEPVGYADQPSFLNAVIRLETELAPQDLLPALLAIEQDYGRDRSHAIPNGPRTLDLDLLLYEDQELSSPGLEVPHPRLSERAFVLIPLAEIAAGAVVPGTGRSVLELAGRLSAEAQRSVRRVARQAWSWSRSKSE